MAESVTPSLMSRSFMSGSLVRCESRIGRAVDGLYGTNVESTAAPTSGRRPLLRPLGQFAASPVGGACFAPLHNRGNSCGHIHDEADEATRGPPELVKTRAVE